MTNGDTEEHEPLNFIQITLIKGLHWHNMNNGL